MYAFAASTCALRWEGQTVRLVEGEVWDASDPLVKARPDLFTDAAPRVRNSTGKPVKAVRKQVVEQATRAPGEKRRGPVR